METEINTRIKKIRSSLNLTQTEFGKNIGLKQNTVGQIENAQRGVTDRTILLICEKYNVREDYIRNGIEPMFIKNDATIISEISAHYNLTNLDKAIMKIFLEMPSEKRMIFKDFAFALVDTILNDHSLFMEYREKYISEKILPFAARNGNTSNLDEAAKLFDTNIESE